MCMLANMVSGASDSTNWRQPEHTNKTTAYEMIVPKGLGLHLSTHVSVWVLSPRWLTSASAANECLAAVDAHALPHALTVVDDVTRWCDVAARAEVLD